MGEKDTYQLVYIHCKYSGIPIFQTSKGNKIGLKDWVVQEIGGKITVFD